MRQHGQELALLMIGFRRLGGIPPQAVGRFPLLVDIGVRADPQRDLPLRVLHGHRPAQVPAILAVGAAKALFEDALFSGGDGSSEARTDSPRSSG